MWKFRLACYAYVSLLTLLLLTPDPEYFLGLRRIGGASGSVGVHFAAFAILGFLVFAGRFPHRGAVTLGLALLYAVGVELLQFFVPLRSVELGDLLENLLGLAFGAALWRIVGDHQLFTGGDSMSKKKRFRLLTPEGLVTRDTFTIADEQPDSLKVDCLLLVHEASGRTMTAHDTRLIPAEEKHDHQAKSVCMNCGRVEGIVEEQVACPHLEENSCELVEIKT